MKYMIVATMLVATTLFALGCGGGNSNQAYCERAVECDMALGMSVADCVAFRDNAMTAGGVEDVAAVTCFIDAATCDDSAKCI